MHCRPQLEPCKSLQMTSMPKRRQGPKELGKKSLSSKRKISIEPYPHLVQGWSNLLH